VIVKHSSTAEKLEAVTRTVLADLQDLLSPQVSRHFLEELITEAIAFVEDEPTGLDVKIMKATVQELRAAFSIFAPYTNHQKVTIFGSARVEPHDPLYEQTERVARELASHGWMIVTGAGPGIMEAGMRGAGRSNSIGVSIKLPHENTANEIIAGDSKYVSMRYFFTRKLMLVKESQGFLCMPGGFGTLDETFELLTLVQTGKSMPVPIVFLDVPGDQYWQQVNSFIEDQLVSRQLVSHADTSLFLVTSDVHEAVHEIRSFYTNYHSLRYVGKQLVVRLKYAITDSQLEVLNQSFAHLCVAGTINRCEPFAVEVRDQDHVQLPRISFHFGKLAYGDLRQFINLVNSFHSLT
jgi:uncharacterized protein (TIGR00730 family)